VINGRCQFNISAGKQDMRGNDGKVRNARWLHWQLRAETVFLENSPVQRLLRRELLVLR
jgi:hypothetical protein